VVKSNVFNFRHFSSLKTLQTWLLCYALSTSNHISSTSFLWILISVFPLAICEDNSLRFPVAKARNSGSFISSLSICSYFLKAVSTSILPLLSAETTSGCPSSSFPLTAQFSIYGTVLFNHLFTDYLNKFLVVSVRLPFR